MAAPPICLLRRKKSAGIRDNPGAWIEPSSCGERLRRNGAGFLVILPVLPLPRLLPVLPVLPLFFQLAALFLLQLLPV